MGRQGVAAPNAVMIALKQLGITCATRGVSTCTCMYFLDNSTDADLLWIHHAPEQAYSLDSALRYNLDRIKEVRCWNDVLAECYGLVLNGSSWCTVTLVGMAEILA